MLNTHLLTVGALGFFSDWPNQQVVGGGSTGNIRLYVNDDGTVDQESSITPREQVFNWVVPTSLAPDTYQFKWDQVSGDETVVGSSGWGEGVWQAASAVSEMSFWIGGVGSRFANVTFSLRQGTGPVLKSINVVLVYF